MHPPHPPMTFSHGVYCHISDFIHMLSGARGFAPACHRRGGADTRGNGANNQTPPEEGRLGPGASVAKPFDLFHLQEMRKQKLCPCTMVRIERGCLFSISVRF